MANYFYDVVGLCYIDIVDGMTFGRSKAQVNFPDDTRMSGLHLKIHINNNVVSVEDLNSKNRTMVDHTEIEPEKPVKLMKNSVIEAGDRKFVLTENKSLDILTINELVDRVENRPVIRLEGRKMIQGIQEKVLQKVNELQGEQKNLQKAIDEIQKKINDENDKIRQIDVIKTEFIKKQDEERRAYFETMDAKIGAFKVVIQAYFSEKNKLEEQFNVLNEKVQQSANRVKKDGV